MDFGVLVGIGLLAVEMTAGFFLMLFEVRELVVKSDDFEVLEVLLRLVGKTGFELVLVFLHASLEMFKGGLFEPFNGVVHVFGTGLLLGHNLPTHDIVMAAEPRDLVLNNFRTSILCTAIGYVYKLVLIKRVY